MPGRTNWSELRSTTIDTPKRDAAVARERRLLEMAELPESWRTFEDGTPVPDWIAGIDDVRGDR